MKKVIVLVALLMFVACSAFADGRHYDGRRNRGWWGRHDNRPVRYYHNPQDHRNYRNHFGFWYWDEVVQVSVPGVSVRIDR